MHTNTSKPTVWRKRILIPFWAVRILFMLFIIVISIFALHIIKKDEDLTMPATGAIVFFMLLIVAVLLIDVLAILMFLRDRLNPTRFLIMNIVQTSFWLAVLLLNVIALARNGIGDGASRAGIGFSVLVLIAFMGLLVYAIIGWRKDRKRVHYTPTNNPAIQPFVYDTSAYNGPKYQNTQPYQQSPA